MTIENIIRPFLQPGVDPLPFHPAGSASSPVVHVIIGAKGGTKTFSSSGSASSSSKMGQIHKEKAPNSATLQSKLAQASG